MRGSTATVLNDLLFVERDVKLYSLTHSPTWKSCILLCCSTYLES